MLAVAILYVQKMIKPTFVLLLLCLCIAGNGQFVGIILNEKPFKAGEKLAYGVKFGPIVGGHATLVLKKVYHNSIIVYHARGEGKTIGIAEKLYSVKDIFESFFDLATILPYKAIRNVKEGKYKKHDEAIFNQASNTVFSTQKDTLIPVPPIIFDMVSLLYYIRSLDLNHIKPGDVLNTVTFFDEELFPFDIRYKGKEEIKTKFGYIQCLRFDPVVEPGRMFDSEDDMTIWLSNDKNHIPVKVRFDLLVGSLRIELAEFSNLKYPLEVYRK
jgi:hypothetical protein